jgi:predicted aspartyl protease
MPRLSIPLGPGGPLVDVGLSVPKAYARWAGMPGTWRALIDTGADLTTVSPGIVAALRPMQIGTQPVSRAGGGRAVCDTYDVRLRFGGHAAPGRWFNLEAVEVQPATANIDVLIGLDILLQIDMTWLGSRRLLVLDL